MYDNDGNLGLAPQWMNARNYSALVLPPDCPTPDYIASLFDAPHDGSHALAPPSPGFFPHQPQHYLARTLFDAPHDGSQALAPPSPGFFPHQPQHYLARLGVRAQRRYRISSEQWQRRWGP